MNQWKVILMRQVLRSSYRIKLVDLEYPTNNTSELGGRNDIYISEGQLQGLLLVNG